MSNKLGKNLAKWLNRHEPYFVMVPVRAGLRDAPPALLCASGTACARAARLIVDRKSNPFRNAASNGPAQDQTGQTRTALDRAGAVIRSGRLMSRCLQPRLVRCVDLRLLRCR